MVATAAVLASLTGSASAAAVSVRLGTADPFAVIAGSGITNTGTTTITGDIGTYPTRDIDQQGSFVLTGSNRTNDPDAMIVVKDNLRDAYANASGQQPPIAVTQDLATFQGGSLTSGVYNSSSSMALTGRLTLTGDADDVFVFQAGTTLITGSDSNVVLAGTVQACNVFWQVGTSATIGERTVFRGTILADTSITAVTGATFEGRLLALDGAVTMDTNTITRPGCATGTTTSSSSSPPPSDTSYSGGGGGIGAGGIGAGVTDTVPADTVPADTVPADTVPADAVPADAVPADATSASATVTGVGGPGASGRVSDYSTRGSGGYSQVDTVPVGSVDTGDGSVLSGRPPA